MTEADTCRKFIVPRLQSAGWEDDPHAGDKALTTRNAEEETTSLLGESPPHGARSASIRERDGEADVKPRRRHLKRTTFFNYPDLEACEIQDGGDRIYMMNRMAKPGGASGRIHPENPVDPVCQPGMNEIIGKFGGTDQFRNAVNQLQSLLYAA